MRHPSSPARASPRRNNGRGFGPDEKIPGKPWKAGLGLGDPGRRVADFDGDGAADILTFGEVDSIGTPVVRLHLTRGTRPMVDADLGYESGFMNPQGGWTTSKLGDFDGDGLTDIVTFVQTGTWTDEYATHPMLKLRVLHQNRSYPLYSSDRLLSISDEGNPLPAVEVFYASKDAITPAPPGTCSYPQRCLQQPFPVVRMLAEAAGGPADLYRWKVYSYEAPAMDLRGRGVLGFGTVREFDIQTRAETITTFNHLQRVNGVYPFAGVPLKTTLVAPIFPLPTYALVEFPDLPHTALEARVVETTYDNEAVWTWPHVYSTRPQKTTTREWEQPVTVNDYSTKLTGTPHHERSTERSYTYDGFGNVITATSVVSGLELISTTTTTYDYRVADWLIALPQSRLTTSYDIDDVAPEPRYVEYDHDDNGLLKKVDVEPQHPDLRQITELYRNDDGLVVGARTTTKDDERWIWFAHDLEERMFVTATWNELGHAYRAAYHPAIGAPVLTSDPNDRQVRTDYDRFGRLRREKPDGAMETTISYASSKCQMSAQQKGMCIKTTTEDGRTGLTYLDEYGRPWETAVTAFDGSLAWTRFAYNVFGNQTQAGRPFSGPAPPDVAVIGPSTLTQYDSLGRVLSVADPNDAITYWHHSGYKTTRTAPMGRVSFTMRDEAGRVIQSADLTDQGTYASTFYAIGPFNQVETITPPDGETIQQTFDKLGRVTWIHDPDFGDRTLTYTGFGEVATVTDTEQAIRLIYDEIGRLQEKEATHQESGQLATERALYFYDNGPGAKGRVTAAFALAPDNTALTFEYDALGRPTKTEWTVAGETFTAETTYDKWGRPDLLKYPEVPGDPTKERFTLQHTYNNAGYPDGIRTPTSQSPAPSPLWSVKARNLDGMLDEAEWETGVTEKRSYYAVTGQLEDIAVAGNGDIYGLHYDYWTDGNIWKRKDTVTGRKEAFTYDKLDRLGTWTLTEPGGQGNAQATHEQLFDYDHINRLERVLHDGIEKETYQHTDPAHPRAVSAMLDAQGGQAAFLYDGRGRQKSGAGRHIEWTSFDLPRSIEGPAGYVTFEYDPFGTRVRKITPEQETITIAGLYERRTTADTVTHVFHAHGSEGPVAQLVRRKTKVTETRDMEYLARDAHGSVGLVFDKSGKEIKGGRLYFDPFGRRIDEAGNPLSTGGPADVTRGFTGHEHDTELGLINMGGRVYDPVQRRFLTPDPLISDLGFGPAYNRFSYALGNPARYVDPSGLDVAKTPMGPPSPPGPSGCEAGACGQDSAPPPIKDLPGTPQKSNPAQGSTETGVTPLSGGTSEQGPSMSDAPAFDAEKAAAAEHEQGLWARLGRLNGNLQAAQLGMMVGGVEAVIGTAVGMAAASVMAALPAPVQAVVQTYQAATAPPPPEVTGNRTADKFIEFAPLTRIIGGFVVSGRKLWEGEYYESGRALARPEAEITMIVVGGLIGGGGSGASPKGVPQIGGAYSTVRAAATEAGLGGEVHHMPSWAATERAGVPGATQWNTPTIWMETADHIRTSSHSWKGGQGAIYRARQQSLIAQGRYLDAMMMDVEDIRSLFGTKYDGAIQQMGEAFWRANQ